MSDRASPPRPRETGTARPRPADLARSRPRPCSSIAGVRASARRSRWRRPTARRRPPSPSAAPSRRAPRSPSCRRPHPAYAARCMVPNARRSLGQRRSPSTARSPRSTDGAGAPLDADPRGTPASRPTRSRSQAPAPEHLAGLAAPVDSRRAGATWSRATDGQGRRVCGFSGAVLRATSPRSTPRLPRVRPVTPDCCSPPARAAGWACPRRWSRDDDGSVAGARGRALREGGCDAGDRGARRARPTRRRRCSTAPAATVVVADDWADGWAPRCAPGCAALRPDADARRASRWSTCPTSAPTVVARVLGRGAGPTRWRGRRTTGCRATRSCSAATTGRASTATAHAATAGAPASYLGRRTTSRAGRVRSTSATGRRRRTTGRAPTSGQRAAS